MIDGLSDDEILKLETAYEQKRWRLFAPDSLHIRYLSVIIQNFGTTKHVTGRITEVSPRGTAKNKEIWQAIDKLHDLGLIYMDRPNGINIERFCYLDELSETLEEEGLLDIENHPGLDTKRQFLIPGHSGLVKKEGPDSETPDFSVTYTLDEFLHIPKGIPHIFKGHVREDGSFLLTISPVL